MSSGSRAHSASRALPPSVPGLPDGMRTSRSLRVEKSERFAAEAPTFDQSAPGSALNTSRSAQPDLRAAARMASPASSARSASAPCTA